MSDLFASTTAACTSPVRSARGPCMRPAGRPPRRRPSSPRPVSRRSPVSSPPTGRARPDSRRRTAPARRDRLFLLGDAAGYVEPFTGEGIAWALASGRAIAPLALRAIERWEPRLAGEWERRSTTGSSAVGRSSAGPRPPGPASALAGPRRPSRSSPASPARQAGSLDHLNAPPSFPGSELTMPATIAGIGTALPTAPHHPVRSRRARPDVLLRDGGAGPHLLGDLPPLGRGDAT